MSVLIKNWITNRLGIILDINTKYFGRHVRDGRLIAQLLHAYDIINSDQLQTITATEDPVIALQNLHYISNWLRYIKVECNPEIMREIANANGSTAVRLFYQLLLALESKDKVYFVTQQKEREKAVGNNRFEISNVRQQLEISKQRPFNPLSKPLIQHEEIVSWYRKKYEQIENQLHRAKKQHKKQILEAQLKFSRTVLPKLNEHHEAHRVGDYEKFQNDLKAFEKKYMEESRDWTYEELDQLMKKAQNMEIPGLDLEVANRYVSMVKKQFRKRAADEKAKSKLELMLVNDLWNKAMEKQEEEFDNLITAKTLKQSEYEKQMLTKCFDVREQIKVIADNRKMVENLVAKKREDEFSRAILQQQDTKNRELEKFYFEKERAIELHRRLYEEKLRLKYMRRYEFCRDITNAFIDVAVRIAQYNYDFKEEVPFKLLRDWKSLFVKGEPIFEISKDVQKLVPTSDVVEEIVGLEMQRQEVLNENDFNTYLSYLEDWELTKLIPDFEQPDQIIENGLYVLGHIVHRLFLIKYPIPLPPPPANIPRFKVSVCITGVKEFGLLPVLQELLQKRNIKIIEMPIAINYCLESYKKEMIGVDDITITLQQETNLSLNPIPPISQKLSPVFDPKSGKSVELARQAKEEHVIEKFADKNTQTPKKIPDEETVGSLGEAALLGKYAYEFMSLGSPLNDHILVAMLVAYLKSLKDWDGWALLNYPITMNQAAILESVITGHYIPLVDAEYDDMDDLSDYPSRGSFDARKTNQLETIKDSELVPNPYKPPGYDIHKTFLTAFISIKHSASKAQKDEEYEFLSEDAPPLEKFYTDQGVNYSLYYNIFDFGVIKRLGKLIIGDYQLPLKTSLDLFGDTVTEMAEKYGGKASKLDSKKTYTIPEPELLAVEEVDEQSIEEESVVILPGEYNYVYVDLPVYDSLGYALATIWENIEIIYVHDMKQLFFIKRNHRDTLVPYSAYIRKHMKDYIQRPDNKQNLVYKFQNMYNDLEEDIRDDEEVQAELHCRLVEMKDQLYLISDERMTEAEHERRRLISENWISEHMIVLTNIFISMMQLELDRCADTIQFVQDYYFTMLGRKMDPNERPLKLDLQKIETIKHPDGGEGDTVVKIKKFPREYTEVGILINNSVANAFIVPEAVSIESLPIITHIHNNSSLAMGQIDQWAAKVTKVIQENQTAFNPAKKKPEEGVDPQDIIRLFEEWMCASDSEISRTRLRIHAIRYRAEKSLTEVLECGQNLFHSLYKEIAVRYDREIKSITNLCSLIDLAIEERIKFQTELVLEGDEFLVNMNTFLYPDKPTPPPTPSRERLTEGDFTVDQLTRLYEIFFDLAPYGSIPERTLIYLIEDLVTQNAEDGFRDAIPELWTKMSPANIEVLLGDMFGDTEFVDWRDFIILNMNIPFPTEQQLLKAWLTYGLFDENKHEIIDRETYNKVTLWFELSSSKNKINYCDSNFSFVHTATVSTNSSVEEGIRNNKIKDLLFSMFEVKKDQINYTGMLLAFCKDYEQNAGVAKALALALRSMVCWDSDEGEAYLKKLEEDRLAEEMRLMTQTGESDECFCGMTDIYSLHPECNLLDDSVVTSKTSTSFIGKEYSHGNVEMLEEEATPERGYVGLSLLHMYSDEELAVYKERAYLIPFEATLVTLAALFPWHIRTKCIENNSLRGVIEQVFLDLKPDEHACVRPWEFLNHPLIQEMLKFYHKFLIVHPTEIVKKLLQQNENEKVHYVD